MSEWERVNSEQKSASSGAGEQTDRLRVPGGYLYRTIVYGVIGGPLDTTPILSTAMCFVPDGAVL